MARLLLVPRRSLLRQIKADSLSRFTTGASVIHGLILLASLLTLLVLNIKKFSILLRSRNQRNGELNL